MEIIIDTKSFDNISDKIKNIDRTMYQKIGQTIKSDLLLNFKKSVAPDQTPWADYKEKQEKKPSPIKAISSNVKKIKKKRKSIDMGNRKMLVYTGNLRESLNYKSSDNRVEIGYSAKYSVFHQLGTKHMVARKILPTESSEIDVEEIERIILKAMDV